MQGARSAVVLMVVGLGGGASCTASPTTERVGAQSQAIIGGSPDTTDTAVVAVVQPAHGILCSGTLVAPGIVLTAAHCVYGVEAGALQVLVGPDTTSPDQTVAVSSVVVYPTYTGEDTGLTGGVDLGAVYLATPLAIPPVTLNTTATDAELLGASVTLVGYGVSSTTNTTDVGVRMDVTTPVSTVCSRLLTLGNADANECSGDSGGAVLLDGALVAVISSGDVDCIAPSNQTRLSAHALWLEAVLSGDAGTSCPGCVQPDPSCTAPVEGEVVAEAGVSDAGTQGGSKQGGCVAASNERTPPGAESGALLVLGLAGVVRRRTRPSSCDTKDCRRRRREGQRGPISRRSRPD